MGYVYAAMWFIAGLILIFRLSKENKIFYVAGGFFLHFIHGGFRFPASAVQNKEHDCQHNENDEREHF